MGFSLFNFGHKGNNTPKIQKPPSLNVSNNSHMQFPKRSVLKEKRHCWTKHFQAGG